MSFYFTKIARVLKQSKIKIFKLKEDYDIYIDSKENKQIAKKKKIPLKEKIFGISEAESKMTLDEKMKSNPFYWFHLIKHKTLKIFSPEKQKLLEKSTTDVENTISKPSKVFIIYMLDTSID